MPNMKFVNVDPDDLIPTMPTYEPLVHALTNESPEERVIPVSLLQIEPAFRAPDWILNLFLKQFAQFHLEKEEFLYKVLVMERRDGTLWVYDDQAYVEAAQRVRPSLSLRCDVYKDPTQ
jgi:hypothetical protein